jgi:uncharacterized protein YqjF (DUF2071 family)
MTAASVFLTARWQSLAMLNYEVDPAVLAPLVPHGTELDLYRGRALVSLVGFMFLDSKLLGWSIPFHRRFEEVNLRFYVRREVGGELRRGVVFVKEIVARPAVTLVANRVYHERYVTLPMQHRVHQPGLAPDGSPSACYRWRLAGRWHGISVDGSAAPLASVEDSEESFVVEHYWGYTRRDDGRTLEYRVEHPRWSIWPATAARLDADVAALYGRRLAPYLTESPRSALWVDGSTVTVYRGRAIA